MKQNFHQGLETPVATMRQAAVFKKLSLLALMSLTFLGGCTSVQLPLIRQEPPAPEPPRAQSKPPASHKPAASSRATPDAVYTLEPGSDSLPSPVNQSLQEFAARMKANRDLVIRLESYVPSGGSREMNVSLSSSAVERVRRRLVELGVPSYRIKQAPLGEEHPDSPQLNNRRVELFLIPLPR